MSSRMIVDSKIVVTNGMGVLDMIVDCSKIVGSNGMGVLDEQQDDCGL